tara:strand:- start:134 stop:820 length:687 start_codon:yes stop_codon:yes gene_type:complete
LITNSNAIVLKRFPYGESSTIARCFVRNNGKLSFIVHGARRKKSPRSAHFQPINCLDLVYYYKPSKNLQTISKSSFSNTWKNISQNFKKITFSMALLELTDKCLSENDPHADLYDELFYALKSIDSNTKNDNLIFWYYQYQVLVKLGFKPDFSQKDQNNTPLPNPYGSTNSKKIFDCFESSNIGFDEKISLSSKDRKIISSYLNTCLKIHFEGVDNFKSLKFMKDTMG